MYYIISIIFLSTLILIAVVCLILITYFILTLGISLWPKLQNNIVIKILFNFYTLLYLLLAKFCAWISKGIVVNLIDYRGITYISVAWNSDNNDLSSYVYFSSNLGPILLKPDGTIRNNRGQLSYIVNWVPHNKYDRLAFILQQNVKSFNIFR
jgi:hypothetical protein